MTSTPATDLGSELHGLVEELLPIPRSLTGSGVRATLDVVARHIPLDVVEVPSGTQVLDWTVPDEWNLRRAWIGRLDGTTVIDAGDSTMRVLGYSEPIDAVVDREELLQHLHVSPVLPDHVPYRTSYYDRTWGFCVTDAEQRSLTDESYRVVIDADLGPGTLTYGEALLPGELDREILLSTHICHPQLANDNCSGIAVLAVAAGRLAQRALRHSVRILFLPGTIGAITWLARNREGVDRIAAGIVLAGVGDRGALTFQRSRQGDATVDRAAALVLDRAGGSTLPFAPWGYDERQYNSPGFGLPVGRLSRTPHGTYPEYHTSADDLDFVTAPSLAGSLAALEDIVAVIDGDERFRNLFPYGEPQLGRRGLLDAIGGRTDSSDLKMAMLWILNLSDGGSSLLDVAERSSLPWSAITAGAALLVEHGLVEPISAGRSA